MFYAFITYLNFSFLFFVISAAAAKSLQSCSTLYDPIGSSPPGSPVPGILQARSLEWIAISFSNTESRLIIFFAVEDGEALYTQQKQDQKLTVAQIMNSLLQNSDLN